VTEPEHILSKPDFSNEWYRDWFDEDYLTLYQHRDSAEARRFLNNVRSRFEDRGTKGVVDLACGAGRHAWVLATEFNWPVVGLDLSLPLLREAVNVDNDQTVRQPMFVRGDLRRLPFADQCCHLVLNAFTSFGYFSTDQEHQSTLYEMSRILAEHGVLIIDLMNPTVAISRLVPEDETQLGQWRVKQTRHYVSETSRIEKTIELTAANGKRRVVQESVRLFKMEEIEAMFAEAGVSIIECWGGYDASSFDHEHSDRMICIAERI